ncbi:pleckstrin homology domain-containing family A member 5-like [Tachyglossus aculeatus]|uniref:pleckstrin homology domain-containing family A member 5-like n=1 Tax=Tachyglossus aculeatus TaxID=9261 RepID=UPI0018F60137|nr:pleckstrin homology domain-containing family A member 5-like [Tachyglossus aculeatus]
MTEYILSRRVRGEIRLEMGLSLALSLGLGCGVRGWGRGAAWLRALPRIWSYGVTRGGRLFFINKECQSTSWLHPVTGEALLTGHRRPTPDLPTGWEEAYTFEGARYYINET